MRNRDLRTLFEGVAGVAAAGLLMGMAMRPDLDVHEISGPQMMAPSGGLRVADGRPDPGVGVYAGKVPDYVYGTDWSRAPVAVYPTAAPVEEAGADPPAAVDTPPPEPVRHVSWREPPREPVVYPSITGDRAYPSERPPPDDAEDPDEG